MKKISLIIGVSFILLFCNNCAVPQGFRGCNSNIHKMGWGFGPNYVSVLQSSYGQPVKGHLVKDREFRKLQLVRYRHSEMSKIFYFFWRDAFVRIYAIQFIKYKGVRYFDKRHVGLIKIFGAPTTVTEQPKTFTCTWKLRHLTIQLVKYRYENKFIYIIYFNRLWEKFLEHEREVKGDIK